MNNKNKLCFGAPFAFTLIELLVVIAIIMLLSGLLMPAFDHARTIAKNTKAKSDVKQIEIAWKAVVSDFRTWTAAGLVENNDLVMDAGNVAYLQMGNSKKILYMEFPAGTTSFWDPWGKVAYHFALGNGSITPSGYETYYRDVGVWSYGRNSSATDTNNHLTSWK